MRPIYMPFTHVCEQSADLIHALLGRFLIYQPGGVPLSSSVSRTAEKGVVEIRTPVEITSDDIMADLKRDYYCWAALNASRSKIETGAFMAAADPIPFYEENSSARIRTEVNRLRRGESIKPQKNALIAARLFLALAQEHDARKNDLTADLNAVAFMEKKMLDNLKGGDDDMQDSVLGQSPVAAEDVGAYMTQQRIEAWSALFMADRNSAPDIFITDSRAVMDQLCDTSDDLVRLADPEISPEGPASVLDQLVQSDDPWKLIGPLPPHAQGRGHAAQGRRQWSIYLAPRISPDRFWARYAGTESLRRKQEVKNVKILNTLVFHFEL